MTRFQKFKWFGFAAAPLVYCPLANWISVARFGTWLPLCGEALFAMAFFIALLGIPFHIIRMFYERHRKSSLFFLLVCVTFVIAFPIGFFAGQAVRIHGIQSFATRSRTLVAAIKQYETANSTPPATLQDLVPRYLPQVPSTGMAAYPSYQYYVGPQVSQRYLGNAWVLEVFTPTFGQFDSVLYFPNQNYPLYGFGGRCEPVGDWAYVHE